MSQKQKKPELVDVNTLPQYPISAGDRLDSHFFIAWNLKRWRKSKFRQLAEPEVGWFGFLLFCEAHDETPVGTLPTDERLLASAIGVTVDYWKKLDSREVNPLHNWELVQCDNGEVRYAHPVVTEVVLEAVKSRRVNQANTEAKRRFKRLKDLEEMIKDRIGAGQLLRTPQFVDRFNDWLEEKHPDVQRREAFIRQALGDFQTEMVGN